MKPMKIVLPMAGKGSRLRPLTWSKPKQLVQIANQPLLGHVLDMLETLPAAMPREYVFITGYLGDQVAPYMDAHHPNLTVHYAEQRELLGQSHAIYQARQFLDGPMLLVWADTLVEADLGFLYPPPDEGVAWVRSVPDPRRFGVAETGPDGYVTRLIEKPQSTENKQVVVGFYYFPDSLALLDAIETQIVEDRSLGGEFYLVDAINILLANGLRMTTRKVDVWLDAGVPETTLETNAWLLEHGRANYYSAAEVDGGVLVPPVYMAPGVRVEESVIGPNVSIGEGAVVRTSVIKNSIIEVGAVIEGSELHDSLVGRRARVSGVKGKILVGDDSVVKGQMI